ncbi:hypothetical protein GCM10010266_49410 [Streptomyces griseomycini]|uniref:hypothetical protein n=1 Tax=Streptomyces griseomycini TaxID=66895 RepID=UPI001874B0F4|nr:hypothetical protein [Streptomyces griseomycini]GGQ20402.1 hypothetical protein GCM10010266_49410 [Streptomyces griseomycini]
MKRAVTLAASTLSLLSLATLTACGGDGEPDNATGEPRPSASRAERPTPEQQLAKLMVTEADVAGYEVTEPSDDFVLAGSTDEVTLDEPACAPLAYAMNQLPLGEPEADLTRVVETEKYGDTDTYVTLTAYAAGGAKAALADLREAVDACGSGFTAEADGTSAYDSVTAEEPTDRAGDETVAFASTMTFRGAGHTLHTQATRSGDVLAVFFSVNGMAIANASPSDAELPPPVVKAQNAKLG